EGKIVALLGANGAGKTTTLKAISNLLRAERGEVTKGTIEFRGRRVDRLSPDELVRLGVVQVMEGRHCFAHLTVEENLLTGGYILENGRVVMDGAAAELAANEDVKEFYLGISSGARRSFKDVKHYRRRKRWLA